MAQKVLGVDLGATAVKVTIVSAGLRRVTVLEQLELSLPLRPATTTTATTTTADGAGAGAGAGAGDGAGAGAGESDAVRGLRVLAEFIAARGLVHEPLILEMPGEAVSFRVLAFPFAHAKRNVIERAIGGELEGQLPHDLEDLVFNFEQLPALATPSDIAGAPGSRVLAAAATQDEVGALLALAATARVDVRALCAAPAAYARAVRQVLPSLTGPSVVVDIGHTRTDVAVVADGRTLFARTLSRGSYKVSQAIGRAWNLAESAAERALVQDGFVASGAQPAPSEAWARVSAVIEVEIRPVVRELRQTLAACAAEIGVTPERLLLAGGGARLLGLGSFLEQELGLPVQVLDAEQASHLLSLGLALEGATGRPAFDLRRGKFAYRADFGFLRQHAGFFAGAGLAAMLFASLAAWAGLHKLRREEDVLAERLAAVTSAAYGKPLTVAEVEAKLAPRKEESPLPRSTAFDQLIELSRRLPANDKVKLDVTELDVRKDKLTVRATSNSRAAVEEIEKGLRSIDCLSEVQTGKITEDAADQVSFTITATSKCM